MKQQYAKYIVSLLIFGTNGIVASFLTLSSTAIIFYRTVIGSLFLLAILLASRQLPRLAPLRGQWPQVLLSGASLGLSWLFLFEAYRQIGVGTATLLYYLGPAIVMAAAPLLFRERITTSRVIGIGAAFLGMALVNLTSLESGTSWGLICGLLSAVLYALMIVANKKVENLSGVERTFIQLLVAGIVVAAYALASGTPLGHVRAAELFPLLILCVVNTGLACYLYFSSMHLLPAQSVAVCSYIDPLSALVFSALFLDERMGPLQLLGAALILGGAAFGELYRSRRLDT